jgi:hypothetical protein
MMLMKCGVAAVSTPPRCGCGLAEARVCSPCSRLCTCHANTYAQYAGTRRVQSGTRAFRATVLSPSLTRVVQPQLMRGRSARGEKVSTAPVWSWSTAQYARGSSTYRSVYPSTVARRYSQSSHSSSSSESSSIWNHSMCRLGLAVVLRSACTPAAVTLEQ